MNVLGQDLFSVARRANTYAKRIIPIDDCYHWQVYQRGDGARDPDTEIWAVEPVWLRWTRCNEKVPEA